MRLDRYIFLEWLKVFFLTFLSILFLLLLDAVQDDLRDLLGYGASFRDTLLYYLILCPSFIPAVLPISFLISLLFVLGSFNQNLEISAMRSAGCSLWRITRSLWITGFILTFVLFELNSRIVPWSMETSKEIWNNHQFDQELREKKAVEDVGLVYNLTFFNSAENRLWFINRFNQFNYRAYGITVSILDSKGNELERIVANEGYFDDIVNQWTFNRGRITTFSVENGEAIRSLSFNQHIASNYFEDPELMKALEARPKDLSSRELSKVIRAIDSHVDGRAEPYAVVYYDRLFNPLSCLIVLGLAIPFALSGVRTNPLVGVSKSMGWFVLYFIISSISQLLGRGFISPIFAALLPNLCAFGFVAYLFVRFRKPA